MKDFETVIILYPLSTFPQIILKIKSDKFLLGGSEVVDNIISIWKKRI